MAEEKSDVMESWGPNNSDAFLVIFIHAQNQVSGQEFLEFLLFCVLVRTRLTA